MRYVTGPANPYVDRETAGLTPGTALDAGCGAGAEAALLASRGWTVTGVDVSPEAIGVAQRASSAVEWITADLTTWHPARLFDLVMGARCSSSGTRTTATTRHPCVSTTSWPGSRAGASTQRGSTRAGV